MKVCREIGLKRLTASLFLFYKLYSSPSAVWGSSVGRGRSGLQKYSPNFFEYFIIFVLPYLSRFQNWRHARIWDLLQKSGFGLLNRDTSPMNRWNRYSNNHVIHNPFVKSRRMIALKRSSLISSADIRWRWFRRISISNLFTTKQIDADRPWQ